MPTYVVKFAGEGPDAFRGRVEDVRTGERTVFSSEEELLTFFARMNAIARRVPGSEEPGAGGTVKAATEP